MTDSKTDKTAPGAGESLAPAALQSTTASHHTAILVLDLALVLLSFWVLRGFFGALGWAIVLATATWPLYERFLIVFSKRQRRILAPLFFTVLIALIFLVPLGVAVIETWREMNGVVHWIGEAQKTGVKVPDAVSRLPFLSAQITDWWNTNLAEPGSITDLVGRADTGTFARITQQIGIVIARRLTLFVFTVLSLFFLFRDGVALGNRFRLLCDRLLGRPGQHLANLLVSAVRSTADGLVLVGLGEGAFLAIAYVAAGVPHPGLLGAFTGLLAIIPFGAPIVFSLAALLLAINGDVPGAIAVEAFGFVVVGIADHLIRPALIGGAAKLPFLWVLLGIFGGLETFGLLGLFLGPAIMAALVSLWREWTDPKQGRFYRPEPNN